MTIRTHARKPLLMVLVAAVAAMLTISVALPASHASSSSGIEDDATASSCMAAQILESGTTIKAIVAKELPDLELACTTSESVEDPCGADAASDDACIRHQIDEIIERLLRRSSSVRPIY